MGFLSFIVECSFWSTDTFFSLSYRQYKNLHRLEKEHLQEIAKTTVKHEQEQNEDVNVEAIDDQSNDGSVSVIHEQLWPAVLSFDENDSEMEDISRHPDAKLDQDDQQELETRRKYLEEDSIQFPKSKIIFLLLLWIGLSVIYLLKGDKGAPSLIGLTCEKPGYYVLVASQFIWTFGFAIVFAYRALRRTETRKAVNYPFNENDILVSCFYPNALSSNVYLTLVVDTFT